MQSCHIGIPFVVIVCLTAVKGLCLFEALDRTMEYFAMGWTCMKVGGSTLPFTRSWQKREQLLHDHLLI